MSIIISLLFNLLAIVTSIVVIAITYLKWSHQYWKKRNIPYLTPHLPFGNWQNPRTSPYTVGFYVKVLYDQIRKKNLSFCGVYFFARPLLIVTDPELLKHVMTKDFQYFTDRGMYYNEKDDPIGAHLFALGGAKWRRLRTKLTPTFTSGKMKTMFPIVVECVNLLLASVEQEQAPEVDVKEVLRRYTTDVIGSCAFGLECNSIKENDSPFRIYGGKVFSSTPFRAFKMTFASNFTNLARKLGIRQIPKDISDFFTQIVHDTVNYRLKNNVERKDFLQLLIHLHKDGGEDGPLTIQEVTAQCFVFFVAGFETSSTTMTFALYELAKHQEMQERLRKEIQGVLEKNGGVFTYDSMGDMKYMSQVLDETLRLYPPVPFVSRTCVKDYRIPDNDAIIEKGTRVILPILGIHRDEEHYPNPGKFDPERFTEENKHHRHPYTHIPFGEGPRICIGMRFGLMQAKLGLATILNSYKLTVSPRTKEPLKMARNSFMLNAEGGIWLNLERLNY